VVNSHVVVTDTEKVIAATWNRFDGAKLSDALIEAIRNKTDMKGIAIEAGPDAALAKSVAIIKCGGNDSIGQSIGAVALVEDKSPINELLMPQVKMAADFLGRLAALNGGVL